MYSKLIICVKKNGTVTVSVFSPVEEPAVRAMLPSSASMFVLHYIRAACFVGPLRGPIILVCVTNVTMLVLNSNCHLDVSGEVSQKVISASVSFHTHFMVRCTVYRIYTLCYTRMYIYYINCMEIL